MLKQIETLEELTDGVRVTFHEMLRENIYENCYTEEEIHKRLKKKKEIRRALKVCPHGDRSAKIFIKDHIKEILVKRYKISENNIEDLICFSKENELSCQEKFDIMLYLLKKKKQELALEVFIEQFHLSEVRYDCEKEPHYEISSHQIEKCYHIFPEKNLDFADKLNILTQRVYQDFKGNGVVDEIRDMKIDGVSAGVSGIPQAFELESQIEQEEYPYSYDSIWIFYKGKSIHLSFLSFKTEKELIRVCKNIYRYQNPGQLSEVNGYIVNEMKDGSRVAVARPPFSETWVFFVRKFDTAIQRDITKLISDKGKEIPICLLKWLMKGCQVTAVTGEQGSGKTTLLMSMIRYINPTYNLRIQELSFELHLRKIYPERNIVTFRETYSISGKEGLDFQKKTDGTVNILGEVATAPVASWMICMSQTASLFTLFTHHAKTTETLIDSMRNALLTDGGFQNEKAAQDQVLNAIAFDVHMKKREDGHRYIERISEIIPHKVNIFARIYKGERRENIEIAYQIKDIVVFEEGSYRVKNKLSEERTRQILHCLSEANRTLFQQQLGSLGVIEENAG